jgi:hypothetical protein
MFLLAASLKQSNALRMPVQKMVRSSKEYNHPMSFIQPTWLTSKLHTVGLWMSMSR